MNFHTHKKLLAVAIIPVSWQVIHMFLNFNHGLICNHWITDSFYFLLFYRFWWALYMGFKWKWLPWYWVYFYTWTFLFSTFPLFFVPACQCFDSSNYFYLVPQMSFIYLKGFEGHSWSLLLARFLVVGSIQQPFLVGSFLQR